MLEGAGNRWIISQKNARHDLFAAVWRFLNTVIRHDSGVHSY